MSDWLQTTKEIEKTREVKSPIMTSPKPLETTTPVKPVISSPKAKKIAIKSNKTSDTVINITSDISISQVDVKQLKQPTSKTQTFRVNDVDLETLKDLSYLLSKQTSPKKVTQGELFRLGILLVKKVVDSDKKSIIGLLKEL